MARGITVARQSVGRVLKPATSAIADLRSRRQVRVALLSLVFILVFVYPIIEQDNARLSDAAQAEIFILLAMGLNIVVGLAGLLDLGYAAFFAIGAYTLATLASAHFSITGHIFSSPFLSFGPDGVHVNFLLMIPVAAIVAAFSGVLFGAPTLRLRGDYLAIVTLGFGEIVPQVIKNLGPNNSLGLPNITNGVNDIVGVDRPPDVNILGLHASFQGNDYRPWYYFGLIIVIFSIVVIASLRSSRLGRAWTAIREDEIAAAHMGINITRTRLLAFGLGAAFSGFAGLLQASINGSADPTSFGFNISITILVMVILGGIGSIPGAILGAIILSYLDLEWLAWINDRVHDIGTHLHSAPSVIGFLGTWLAQLNLQSARPLIFGIILVAIMLLRPQGLWPSATRAREMRPETAEILSEENSQLYTARSE